MSEEIKKLNDDELIQLYPALIKELKDRKIIRTNNIVGDLGEYFSVKIFNENSNLPKLQMAPTSTENVDALSIKGKRYAIKSTSSKNTGIFASIPNDEEQIYFEYLLILLWDKNYQVESLLQYNWAQFVKYRKIKKPENRFHISLNKTIMNEAVIIYSKKG